MKKFNIKLNATIAVLVVAMFFGCTDLDEKVLDENLNADIGLLSALAAAYRQLGYPTFSGKSGVYALQEYSTDEDMLPTRGSDWGDGGKWRALHEFTWAPNHAVVTDTWYDLTVGITKSLAAIQIINANKEDPEHDLALAEAQGLLAFYTFHTLDLYDQAPYKDPLQENAKLEILKADTAIDTLIRQVEALIPNLADIGTQSTYNGRFTKQVAYALLADMYLNRAVYKDRYNASSSFNFKEAAVNGTGTDMDKVIEYTSKLINDSHFSLETNYFDNFSINDDKSSSELIFAVVQKSEDINIIRSSNDFAYMPTARNQKPTPSNRGTNASCTTPEFYKTWEGNHEDPRFHRYYQYKDKTWFMNDGTTKSVPVENVPGSGEPWFHFNRGFQVDQQYGPLLKDGKFEMTADGKRIKVSKLMMEKSDTTPMDFTPELNFSNPSQAILSQDEINKGVRIFKYEFDPYPITGKSKGSSVDIPLYRLGGIYCMRAEAYFRKGETASALSDINVLRTQRTKQVKSKNTFVTQPGKSISSLDETKLYNEIGFEMHLEMYRRKQMIRFGTFDEAYTAKPESEPFRRVFPIPQKVIDVNKEIKQNQGY